MYTYILEQRMLTFALLSGESSVSERSSAVTGGPIEDFEWFSGSVSIVATGFTMGSSTLLTLEFELLLEYLRTTFNT